MKKLIFTLLSIVFASTAFSQYSGWYIGGNVGLTGNRQQYNGYYQNYTNWNFGPEAGIWVRKDIQLGLSLGLSGTAYRHVDGHDNLQENTVNFSPLIYARKHFKIVDNFNVFIGANLGANSGSTTYYDGTSTSANGFSAYLNAGVLYQVNPKFALVGQYGFLGYQQTNNNNGKLDSFGLNVNTLGPVFNVGIYFTVNKNAASSTPQ